MSCLSASTSNPNSSGSSESSTSNHNTVTVPPLPELCRRIVTSVDPQSKKSNILIDDTGGYIQRFPDDIYRFQTVWYSSIPANCSTSPENPVDLDPMRNITRLEDIPNSGVVVNSVWTKPLASVPLHKTPSLDFGILLEGIMELIMEDGDIRLLKPGDVVIQRETLHGWRNPSATEWCKMLFVGVASTTSMADQTSTENEPGN